MRCCVGSTTACVGCDRLTAATDADLAGEVEAARVMRQLDGAAGELWRAAEEQRVVLAAAMAQAEGKRAHARRKEAQKADRRCQAEVERAQRELEWSYTRRAGGGGDGRVGPLVLDDRLADAGVEAPQMIGGLVLPPASEMQWVHVRDLQQGLRSQ